MSKLRHLIQEIHRRSLWQVLSIYGVSAWIIWQIVVSLYGGIGLPDWVPPTALVLLLVGLPIVLGTAFIQEGGPGRHRGDSEAAVPGLETNTIEASRQDAGDAPRPDPGPPQPPARRPILGLFTWSRAITGGVLAFAALGLATTGFMGMRAMGVGPAGTLISRGVLEERARIVVADFDALPADSILAVAVTEALRIDLGQSRALSVVDPSEIGPALARMQLPASTRLSEEVVREMAIREGVPAVLLGDVIPVGAGYQITARLITPDTGRVLIRARQTARGQEDVLPAVDRLTATILERAGESFRSIRATPPLAAYTTSSLVALQLFGEARRAMLMENDYERAVDLLERAVALDSTFAMAWRTLGAAQANIGRDYTRAMEAFTRAAELSERLPEAERLRVLSDYYRQVDYQPERAIAAYERYAELTGDVGALNNLALLYGAIGESARAAEVGARAAMGDSAALTLGNLVLWQITAGDMEAAARTFEARTRLYPDNPQTPLIGWILAYIQGDMDGVRDHLRVGVEHRSPVVRQNALMIQALLALREGRISEGYRILDDRSELLQQRGLGLDDERLFWVGLTEVFVRGDMDRAGVIVETLATEVIPAIPELDRPHLMGIVLAAASDRPDIAQSLMTEWQSVTPEGMRRRDRTFEYLGRGLIEVRRGQTDEAFRSFRRAVDGTDASFLIAPFQAWAYDLAGQPDSALAAYRRFESDPHANRLFADAIFLGLTYQRMGELYEERGDIAGAAHYYGRFIDLWREADPELQPRVEAARRALARLAPGDP